MTEVGARRVKILFPVVSESRIYATDSAPLSRIAYSIGDIISNDQDIAIKVEQIDQKEGLLSEPAHKRLNAENNLSWTGNKAVVLKSYAHCLVRQ